MASYPPTVGGYDDEGTVTEAGSGTPAALSERNGFELAVEDTNQRLVAMGLPGLPSSYSGGAAAATSESQTVLELVGELLQKAAVGTLARTESEDYVCKLHADLEMETRRSEELVEQVGALRQEEQRQTTAFKLTQESNAKEVQWLTKQNRQLSIQVEKLVGKEDAYQVQLRKKENEYNKLQDMLSKQLNRGKPRTRALTSTKDLQTVAATAPEWVTTVQQRSVLLRWT